MANQDRPNHDEDDMLEGADEEEHQVDEDPQEEELEDEEIERVIFPFPFVEIRGPEVIVANYRVHRFPNPGMEAPIGDQFHRFRFPLDSLVRVLRLLQTVEVAMVEEARRQMGEGEINLDLFQVLAAVLRLQAVAEPGQDWQDDSDDSGYNG